MSEKAKELLDKSESIIDDLEKTKQKLKSISELINTAKSVNDNIINSNKKCAEVKIELERTLTKFNSLSGDVNEISRQNESLIKSIKDSSQKVQEIYNSVAKNITLAATKFDSKISESTDKQIDRIIKEFKMSLDSLKAGETDFKNELKAQTDNFVNECNKIINELKNDYRKHNTESFNRMSECLNTTISRVDILSSTIKAFNDSVSTGILSIDKKLDKVYEISNDIKDNASAIKQVNNDVNTVSKKINNASDEFRSFVERHSKFETEVNEDINRANSTLEVILNTIQDGEKKEEEYRSFIKKQLKQANILRYIMTAGIGISIILLIVIIVL